MLGGGGGGVSHPLQLTIGLVINSSVTTSPTLAGEHMLLIPKVSILSEQTRIIYFIQFMPKGVIYTVYVSYIQKTMKIRAYKPKTFSLKLLESVLRAHGHIGA